MSSGKWRPSGPGLSVLTNDQIKAWTEFWGSSPTTAYPRWEALSDCLDDFRYNFPLSGFPKAADFLSVGSIIDGRMYCSVGTPSVINNFVFLRCQLSWCFYSMIFHRHFVATFLGIVWLFIIDDVLSGVASVTCSYTPINIIAVKHFSGMLEIGGHGRRI